MLHLISGQSLESGPENLLVLDGASRVLLLEMPLDLLRVLRPLRTKLALVRQNVFEGRNFVNFEQIFGLSTDHRLFDDDRTNGRFGKFDALWVSNLRVWSCFRFCKFCRFELFGAFFAGFAQGSCRNVVVRLTQQPLLGGLGVDLGLRLKLTARSHCNSFLEIINEENSTTCNKLNDRQL